jgi:hypothetical protein
MAVNLSTADVPALYMLLLIVVFSMQTHKNEHGEKSIA